MQHFCVVAADNYHSVSGARYNPGVLRSMADHSALRVTQFGNFALLGKLNCLASWISSHFLLLLSNQELPFCLQFQGCCQEELHAKLKMKCRKSSKGNSMKTVLTTCNGSGKVHWAVAFCII